MGYQHTRQGQRSAKALRPPQRPHPKTFPPLPLYALMPSGPHRSVKARPQDLPKGQRKRSAEAITPPKGLTTSPPALKRSSSQVAKGVYRPKALGAVTAEGRTRRARLRALAIDGDSARILIGARL